MMMRLLNKLTAFHASTMQSASRPQSMTESPRFEYMNGSTDYGLEYTSIRNTNVPAESVPIV